MQGHCVVITPDLFHMLVHLLQLSSHVRAVHVIGVTNMIYTQVMSDHHIPLCWLSNAWYQILQHCTANLSQPQGPCCIDALSMANQL